MSVIFMLKRQKGQNRSQCSIWRCHTLLEKSLKVSFMAIFPQLIVSPWTLYNCTPYWFSHLVEWKSPSCAGKRKGSFFSNGLPKESSPGDSFRRVIHKHKDLWLAFSHSVVFDWHLVGFHSNPVGSHGLNKIDGPPRGKVYVWFIFWSGSAENPLWDIFSCPSGFWLR